MMLLDLLFIALGLVGLFFGGNWLVQGASRLAASLGVAPLVIGLTVVAFGTSAPELLVSLGAALRGEPEVSIGSVVGSNTANIGLILCTAGLIAPIPVQTSLIRREIPIALGAALLLFVLALDGSIGTLDGLLLVAGIIAFTAIMFAAAKRAQITPEKERLIAEVEGISGPINARTELGRLAAGFAALLVGSNLLVEGAIRVAEALQIPEVVIGLTLVAIGTSLPELVTAIAAARHGETEILVGNIVGANTFNILLTLGVTALIAPVPVGQSVLSVNIPVMIGFSLLLVPLALRRVLRRGGAFVIMAVYVAYVATEFLFL